jgi:N-acetylmuramoyl-L-alanine amidase
MNIQRNLLTVNPFSRPGKPLRSVRGIVIHWVGNAGSSALANQHYFASLQGQSLADAATRYASAHFIVGIQGEVIQCIPTNEMAYHVGAKRYTTEALGRLGPYPNTCTWGIELCHPDASGQFTEASRESAVHLCARLCVQQGLLVHRDIWTHHGITGKYCPKYFVDVPGEFERFKAEVGRTHG